jgi:transcriptional regulator with XRE-family HTH domain
MATGKFSDTGHLVRLRGIADLRMNASDFPPRMAKPWEMLRDLVTGPEKVISQAELARRLKVDFKTVHRWAKGLTDFDELRQRQVAEELDLAPTWFSEHDDVVAAAKYKEKIFGQFLQTDLGQSTTDEERRLLRAARFDEKMVPTVSIYRAWLLVLRGALTEEQVERAVEEQRRLLEVARAKLEAQRRAKREEKAAKKKPRPKPPDKQ